MWALISGLALAGGWNVTPLFLGTDIVGDTGDVAGAIAIAGAPGRVAFALVREVPVGAERESHLYVTTLDCRGWQGCPTPLWQEVGIPQLGDGPLPSLAFDDAGLLHLLHGAAERGCGVRNAVEEVIDPLLGVVETWPVHAPESCGDAQLSQITTTPDRVWACWTVNPITAGQDNEIWCGTRPRGTADTADTGAAAGWSVGLTVDGALTQDHGWFVVDGEDRWMVNRDRSPDPDVARFTAPGTDGELPDGNKGRNNDFPMLARAADGTWHATWVEERDRVSYARCVSGGCDTVAGWAQQPRAVRRDAAGPIDHPQLVIAESGRIFLFWTEDHDPVVGLDQRRIHVKEKCPSEAMFSVSADAGEQVMDLGSSPFDQTLLIGRPRVWIDEDSQTLHLVWLEKDIPGDHPSHGDAYWAWKPIDPCP